MKMTSETDLAWLAGIVDGEGSISGSVHKNRGGYVRVSIINSDSRIINRCKEIFKEFGSTLDARSGKGHLGSKTIYRIYTGPNQATLRFLKAIHPYLVGKQEQATLAIGFCSLVGGPGGVAIPEKIAQFRRALIRGMQALNQRGDRIRLP